MYKLIINGKLCNKQFESKEEVIVFISTINQVKVFSLNLVEV